MNNKECKKIKTEIINVNTNTPMLYPYSLKINKCKVNEPYVFLIPLKT